MSQKRGGCPVFKERRERLMLWVPVTAILAAVLAGTTLIAALQLNTAQSKINCATPWLEKAVTLHDLHLKDPTTTTEESQLELMDQIMKAYECLTGKPMTEIKH